MSTLPFTILLKTRKIRLLRPLHKCLLKGYNNAKAPVQARVHGFDVLLNPGNNYPFLIQDVKTFNAPLVELVHQLSKGRKSALCMIDVGAACGDSVLLIKAKCPGEVAQFICVEGDREFYDMLSHNMAQFDDVRMEHVLLSDEVSQVRSLVKHHRGSATAKGSDFTQATTLDALSEGWHGKKVDLLKIDVDGFDGKVIAGSRNLLQRDKPAVIFEWHPKLTTDCGNDPLQAFRALYDCGYTRFVWFTNVGAFSHFSGPLSVEELEKMIRYLLCVNHRRDEHYDVVALHASETIDEVALAATEFFRSGNV